MDRLLIDIKELSKLLSIPVSTAYEHKDSGKIPAPLRIGKKLLWRFSEIENWISAGCPGCEKWETIKK